MARAQRRRLMRRGSIPVSVHGLVEYGEGVLFIASPFLFSFETDGPTVLAALVGAAFLVLAVITDTPSGLTRSLPLETHVVLDYVLAVFLIGAPFLFGFTDDEPALAFFLVLGVLHLMMSVMTRYRAPTPPG